MMTDPTTPQAQDGAELDETQLENVAGGQGTSEPWNESAWNDTAWSGDWTDKP